MDNTDFNMIVDRRLVECRKILSRKAEEYAGDVDRLENFKRAGRLQRVEPETALLGMWAKHLVSVIMMMEDVELEIIPSQEYVDEKIGDLINYAILLEALLTERRRAMLEKDITPIGQGTGTACDCTRFAAR